MSLKTAAGMTLVAEVGNCIGPKTANGALMSQVNLDIGLNQFISGSSDKVYYCEVRLQPMAYQSGKDCDGCTSWEHKDVHHAPG